MSELPWLKLYTESFHDPKFVVAATDNQMDEMTVFGIWNSLLCLAARSPIRGKLVASNNRNYTIEQLDAIIGWHGNMGTGDLSSLMESFIDLDMVGIDEQGAYYIMNFEIRQETQEERNKRLNAERQKRFREQHKGDESVTNNVTNNAPVTQDSSSISISNSLINNDSLSEKTIFSISDAEKAYIQVTGFVAAPGGMYEYLEKILTMINSFGWDETITRLKDAKDNWITGKNKSTGDTYKLTTAKWIDNAMTGERINGKPKQLTREERDRMEVESMRIRNR